MLNQLLVMETSNKSLFTKTERIVHLMPPGFYEELMEIKTTIEAIKVQLLRFR